MSAAELPTFELVAMETPTPLNPLGAKGIGESGTIGSTPAVQNAVIDALAHLGVRHLDMPCTPERVWRAIRVGRLSTSSFNTSPIQVTGRGMADKITANADGSLNVSDKPIIPFIEGDGTGVDIWPAAKLVLDAAAAKHGRKVAWKEVLAGEKAFNETGDWLPQDTIDTFQEYLIGIKGPLTTPIGGGFRSLNVALRQILDLYVCLRPVRWFTGVPSPVKHPELVDMVIFRENTEDIYAGLEVEAGTAEAKKLRELLHDAFGWEIREDSGIGIKPVSETGSKRLIRAALNYAKAQGPQERHARAQGQHHEVHRGRVPQLGLRARARRSSPTWPSAGTTAAASRATRSWSRTPSPTSPSSRCSPGPPSSTWSRR